MIVSSIKNFLISRKEAPLWEISLETGFSESEVEGILDILMQQGRVISKVVKGTSFTDSSDSAETVDGCRVPECGGGCSSCGSCSDFARSAFFPVYSWR